jgi:hypothetical protein
VAWLAVLLLACGAASAQDAGTSYEVELVVFRHRDAHHTAETPAPAASAGPHELAQASAVGVLVREGAIRPAPLPPAELELGDIAARLRRAGPYELLFHGGWIQEVTEQARAAAAPLPPEAVQQGAVGSVTLWRERFLHVLVDIALRDAEGRIQPLQRLRQSRRLRGSALQYFDNPALGAILVTRPVVAGTAAAPAP